MIMLVLEIKGQKGKKIQPVSYYIPFPSGQSLNIGLQAKLYTILVKYQNKNN